MALRASAAWLLLPALVLAGCEKDEALVRLRPVGESLERTLTLQRVDHDTVHDKPGPHFESVPTEVLTGPRTFYGAEQPSPRQNVHVFRGTFAGRLPDDLGGGFGSYACGSTELGSSSVYLERFRGAGSAPAIFAAQSVDVDRAVSTFASWLRPWLDGYAEGERVVAFVEGDLRRDLTSLITTMWLTLGASRPAKRTEDARPQAAELQARLAHFLLERSYLDPGDLPTLTFPMLRDDAIVPSTPRWLRGLLARKAKVTDARTQGRLRELFDSPEAATSLKAHLDERSGTNGAPMSAPFLQLVWLALGTTLVSPEAGDVTLELDLPVEPLATNGTWDPVARRVSWSFPLPSPEAADRRLAQFCRATWATPDEARQRALFGRVVLQGERLACYCLWRSRLPRARAAEWSSFLDGLRPGPGLGRRLHRFAFSDGPTDRDLAKVLAWLAGEPGPSRGP